MSSFKQRFEEVKTNLSAHSLAVGFELRLMDRTEFSPLWEEATKKVFATGARLNVATLLTEAERESMRDLSGLMGDTSLVLRFGIFHEGKFVGWHVGDQRSPEEFYMRNSGVLSEFQGRGLYTSMLKAIVPALKHLGFQVISSKHNASNNRVIIPKLKLGFMITGLEVSDKFGTLVRLEYFTNQVRKEIMDYRCGLSSPPQAAKAALGL